MTVEVRRARRFMRRPQFYARVIAANGKETWRTSETLTNRVYVVTLATKMAAALGADLVDLT